jgi:hypothetical protein
VAYRDDRQALELQVAQLERQNEKLRDELDAVQARFKEERARGRQRKQTRARGVCPSCGGSLLPAAVFAGSAEKNPVQLRMSTLRFGSPHGGFTHSAPVQAKVCGTCGFIHHYIDLGTEAGDRVTQEIPPGALVEDDDDEDDEDDDDRG